MRFFAFWNGGQQVISLAESAKNPNKQSNKLFIQQLLKVRFVCYFLSGFNKFIPVSKTSMQT